MDKEISVLEVPLLLCGIHSTNNLISKSYLGWWPSEKLFCSHALCYSSSLKIFALMMLHQADFTQPNFIRIYFASLCSCHEWLNSRKSNVLRTQVATSGSEVNIFAYSKDPFVYSKDLSIIGHLLWLGLKSFAFITALIVLLPMLFSFHVLCRYKLKEIISNHCVVPLTYFHVPFHYRHWQSSRLPMWGGLLLSSQLVRPDTLPDWYLWQPGSSNLCWPVCGLSSQHLQQPRRPDCMQTMWKRFRVRGRSVFSVYIRWLIDERGEVEMVNPFRTKTPNIYSQEEINLYCIIKLAT